MVFSFSGLMASGAAVKARRPPARSRASPVRQTNTCPQAGGPRPRTNPAETLKYPSSFSIKSVLRRVNSCARSSVLAQAIAHRLQRAAGASGEGFQHGGQRERRAVFAAQSKTSRVPSLRVNLRASSSSCCPCKRQNSSRSQASRAACCACKNLDVLRVQAPVRLSMFAAI